jgi:hypothetical protein
MEKFKPSQDGASTNKDEQSEISPIPPKIQEYINRVKSGESIDSFGEIPESWKKLIKDNTESVEKNVETKSISVEREIEQTFQRLADGAREGLKQNFQEKIIQYVNRINSGEPKHKVLEGLPSSFVSAVEEKLLKSEIENLYKTKEIIDVEEYFREHTISTENYKYNPDLMEGSMEILKLNKELLLSGADRIQAHGMTKGNIGSQFKSLLEILQNGTDKERNNGVLYTGPLVIDPENAAGAGAAIGTSGGTAYIDGGFMLVAKKDANDIKSAGDIAGILVNEEVSRTLPDLVSKLQSAFPGVLIRPYSQSVEVVNHVLQNN